MNKKLLENALNHMTDAELMRTWNVIHKDGDAFHIYEMSELDTMLKGKSPLEILRAVPSGFDSFCDYFYADCMDEIQSIDKLSDFSDFEVKDILDYVGDYGLENFPDLKFKAKELQKDAQNRIAELENEIQKIREELL